MIFIIVYRGTRAHSREQKNIFFPYAFELLTNRKKFFYTNVLLNIHVPAVANVVMIDILISLGSVLIFVQNLY